MAANVGRVVGVSKEDAVDGLWVPVEDNALAELDVVNLVIGLVVAKGRARLLLFVFASFRLLQCPLLLFLRTLVLWLPSFVALEFVLFLVATHV